MPSDQDEANHYSEISEEIYPLTPSRPPSTAARSKRQLAETASPLTSPPAAPSAAPAVRSQTPEPAVRAAGTRGGGGRLSMDVEAVCISGAPEAAQVSRVWLTDIGSTSKEFCVDVSLASGVTLTVPHMSDDNDGHWFSVAKDAASSQRLLARFESREPPPSPLELLLRLAASPFAKELSTLAVLSCAAAVSLGARASRHGGGGGGGGRPPRHAARERVAAPPATALEAVAGFWPWLLACTLDQLSDLPLLSPRSESAPSGWERLLVVSLCAAFAARLVATARAWFPRVHQYQLFLQHCVEGEGEVPADGRIVERVSTRTLFHEIIVGFAACVATCGEGGEAEVQLEPLLSAFASLRRLGEAIGPLMALSVKNDESNVAKVRKVWARLAEQQPGRVSTVRQLLESEREAGIHKPGAVLADPSAAMALLWMRRTIEYYVGVMQGVCDNSASLSSKCRTAYGAILEPFHGWLLKNTFSMALAAVPSRDEFVARLSPNHLSSKAVRRSACFSDIRVAIPLMEQVVAKLRALFAELDLEDTRKS